MTGMFNQMYLRRRIDQADDAARRGAGKATTVSLDVQMLEDRVARLSLICAAMWELLSERTGLAEDDLIAKVHEIDIADGVADGKVSKSVKKCPKCSRTVSVRHKWCLYCGEELVKSSAFDDVT